LPHADYAPQNYGTRWKKKLEDIDRLRKFFSREEHVVGNLQHGEDELEAERHYERHKAFRRKKIRHVASVKKRVLH
jgi:hypothetical protein